MLGMLDIEMLDILKIMCEMIGGQYDNRKFDSQTVQTSISPSCKANRPQQINTDNIDVNMLMQACQIISGPASTEQQTKE